MPPKPRSVPIGVRLTREQHQQIVAGAEALSETIGACLRLGGLARAQAVLRSRTPALADVELKADSATIERKATLRLASFKTKADRTVEAVFWTADGAADLDGDSGSPSAFTEGQRVVISAWAHSAAFGDDVPVGKGVLHIDGPSIIVKGQFFDTAAGRDAHATIKELSSFVELSMAYKTKKSREPTEGERQRGITRVLLEVEVLEVSFVLRGAAGPGRSGVRSIKKENTSSSIDVAAIAGEIRARDTLLNPAMSPEETERRYKSAISVYQRRFGPLTEVNVNVEKRDDAHRFAAWIASKIGIDPFPVKFFATGALGSIAACYRPGDAHIWVKASASSWELFRLVAHEGAHKGRHDRGLPDTEETVRADEEQLVHLYAKEISQ